MTGTAVREAVKAPPAGPRPRVTGRAVLLVGVVIALLVAAVNPVRTLLAQQDRIADLEETVRELEDENARLGDRIEQLRDPGFLERVARECLGMVRPGEIPFVLLPEEGEPEPLPC
ncbi:MAG: septum formation initiator family protein [Actinobacteria bacterium]|nr:septum formation initiator family protein [Actinomycetota bacterium]